MTQSSDYLVKFSIHAPSPSNVHYFRTGKCLWVVYPILLYRCGVVLNWH